MSHDMHHAQAIHSLIGSAHLLDVESADLFSEWLGLFLAEKQFKWQLWYGPDKAGLSYTWLDLLVRVASVVCLET